MEYEVIKVSELPDATGDLSNYKVFGFITNELGQTQSVKAPLALLIGPEGKSIEMQTTETHIQWRVQGTETWINLIALSVLQGAKGDKGDIGDTGKSIELQRTASYIQWRVQGATEWINLVELSILKGDPGKDFTIIAHYDTVELLRAAVTNPAIGDAYTIGTTLPYDVYTYDAALSDWRNNGPLQGPEGPEGPQGEQGPTGKSGVHVGADEPTDPEVEIWIDPEEEDIPMFLNSFGESQTQGVTQDFFSSAVNSLNAQWVGVVVDESMSSSEPAPKSSTSYRATELKRTGNLNNHRFGNSRIFNAFKGVIVNRASKTIAWELDRDDLTLKADGTPSVPDWTIHNICILIPDIYRARVPLNKEGTKYELRYDIEPFAGAQLWHKASFHSISHANMDRVDTVACSVVSDDARFRGGANYSSWDAQPWRSLLGMPATTISRTAFENYAAAAGWESISGVDYNVYAELTTLYFANTNIQLAYDATLTAEGYPQGGLGSGISSFNYNRWVAKSAIMPFCKTGAGSLAVGVNVGIKNIVEQKYYIGTSTSVEANRLISTTQFSTASGWSSAYVGKTIQNMDTLAEATIVSRIDDNTLELSADIFSASGQWFWIKDVTYSYDIPVFFGLENLYGHIWSFISGYNIVLQSAEAGGKSIVYYNPDYNTRSESITADYTPIAEIARVDGYVKKVVKDTMLPSETGASSTTYYSDYAYVNYIPATGEVLRALLAGGYAILGANAGLRFVFIGNGPSNAYANIGFRLRALAEI